MIRQQQLFGFLFEQVYQDQVVGVRREIFYGIATNIGCLRNIKRSEVVADVNQIEGGVNLQQLTLYRSHQVILLADVRGEGDYWHSIVLLNQFSFIKIEFMDHFIGE